MKTLKKKPRSAGFIVVRNFGDPTKPIWRVLGLRVWDRIDIPKGHLEDDEDDLTAAYRETEEEAGIGKEDLFMRWGNIFKVCERPHKDVCIFLAETSREPFISKNPETNRYEHHDHHWMRWGDAKRKCYPYLAEVFEWAKSIVEGTV